MTVRRPLSSETYNEAWLNSAWGDSANQSLLTGKPIIPRPRLSRAIELAALTNGMKLLDIACGRGEFSVIAAYQGAEAIGIDFSLNALKFANKVRKAHFDKLPKQGTINLIQANATTLPFADNSFDRITMLDIIEHLTPKQLDAMFIEVKRLLKPDGYAVIHTLPNRWVYNISFPLLNLINRKFPKDPRGPFDKKIHINEQTLPKLHKTLKQCKLKHTIWLEQHMASQARWNAGKDIYGDNRDHVYPMLAGTLGRFLEILSKTPLKLLISNDIYGLLWKSDLSFEKIRLKKNLTEKLAILILR